MKFTRKPNPHTCEIVAAVAAAVTATRSVEEAPRGARHAREEADIL